MSLERIPKRYFYGDGFFESLIVVSGAIPFWSWHKQRIADTLAFFKATAMDSSALDHIKEHVLNECLELGPEANYRVRITFNREGEGTYRPQSHQFFYLIAVAPLEDSFFCSNKTFRLGAYTSLYKPSYALSNFKTQNALVSVMAQQEADQNGWDDMILFNERKEVVESSNSNLFIIKNEVIYTPPLSSGCLDGVMRRIVCQVFTIVEKVLYEEDLLMADEIFLTSGISGIKLVKQYRETSYLSTKSAEHQQSLLSFLHQQLLST